MKNSGLMHGNYRQQEDPTLPTTMATLKVHTTYLSKLNERFYTFWTKCEGKTRHHDVLWDILIIPLFRYGLRRPVGKNLKMVLTQNDTCGTVNVPKLKNSYFTHHAFSGYFRQGYIRCCFIPLKSNRVPISQRALGVGGSSEGCWVCPSIQ